MGRRLLRGSLAVAAFGFGVLAYVYLTLPDVRELRTRNPTDTAFMRLRREEAEDAGKKPRQLQRWVAYSRISPSLKRAVLVAEDDAFWDHDGVDFEQIRKSIEINLQRGAAVRGASTLTQQLAKNLYLSPSRNPVRKLRELIIARRLEAALPKARIFEIYLNVIEWGDGIWGVDAAARHYFGVPASRLNATQSALLAGAIVNPRVLSPARPNARLRARQRMLLARMGGVRLAPAPPPADAVPGTPAATPVVLEQEGASEPPDTPVAAPTDAAPVDPPSPSPAEETAATPNG